jgi:hypothetical protein
MCVVKQKTVTEAGATRLLKWLFYSGCGTKYLAWRFPEYELQDDDSWKEVIAACPQTWTTPENRIKWSPVDCHLRGAFRGVVRDVGETHTPFITVDADRHTADVPAERHIREVMEIGRLLTSRFGHRYNLRWAVEVNPRNGSTKFFGFSGRPIPENTAKQIGKEIHDALVAAGLGKREVFPANGPKVFLPLRPDKITIIGSGVVPKVMRRRRDGDPVECYSALAFWTWAKTGRSYDEATLVETLAAACRGLPDVVATVPPQQAEVKTKRTDRTARRTKTVLSGIADLRGNPDSFSRQRDALLIVCRGNKRVVGVEEALSFIRQHRLYTGGWEEGLGRRTIRVGQILDFIAHTFDADKCRSSHPVIWINLGRFVRWASCCQGWRAERVTMDEYGRIMRIKDRTVVGPEFLSVFMAVVEYVLITDRNEDDTVPQERAKAIWDDLYRTGQTNVKYCPRKWAICRNKLESMGIIKIDHTHFHGQAMRWWPTDLFPCQPKQWKAGKVRGMLDPVELGDFLEERRQRELHNSLLQHIAINGDIVQVWASFPPPARGSPWENDFNSQAISIFETETQAGGG